MTVPCRRALLSTLPFALLASAGLHAAPLDYTACTDNILPGSLCAMHAVPASHEAQGQDAETLQLFVRKIPAEGRSKGSVWLVAGGPGESGASFYSLLPTLRRSFAGFDLLIPDHRGTGYSSRLCPAEEAAGSPGGMALAGAEWASCFKDLNTAPARARQFSISNAAQDLRSLVGTTQGNGAVYLYGVSYGTQLVLRSLQLGALPVRGVILDSLVPPQSDPRWDLSQRSQVVNQVGLQVLAQCDADAACHAMLGEPAQTLYRRVLGKLRQEPALLATIPGKNLKHFIGGMLDVPAARARIPALLQDLDHGGGTELAAVRGLLNQAASSLGSYPQSSISIPLVSMISNSENNLRPGLTTADVDREEADAADDQPPAPHPARRRPAHLFPGSLFRPVAGQPAARAGTAGHPRPENAVCGRAGASGGLAASECRASGCLQGDAGDHRASAPFHPVGGAGLLRAVGAALYCRQACRRTAR